MVPRQDGIILGGTFELDSESATHENIISVHKPVLDAMR